MDMEEIRLPKRLKAIADWVQQDASLADVGTDHGLLPLELLRTGRIRSAVATDINPGPLQRARANAEAREAANIRFLLCDGLADVSAGEVNTVVIAGLGGENIVSILERAPWVNEGVQLLLQPMSRSEVLHRALSDLGLRLTREQLVEDTGRVYPILEAWGGEPRLLRECEYYAGPYPLLRQEPLFPRYLEEQLRRFSSAVRGLEKSSKPGDQERLEELRIVLLGLKAMQQALQRGEEDIYES